MARVKLDKQGHIDAPTLILQNKNFDNVGNIVNVSDMQYKENFNDANEFSFTVYKKDNLYWDKIKDLGVLYIPELKEKFELTISKTKSDNIKKVVTGTSLCETELGQIKLRDIEINTETDILNPLYDSNFPTLFYRNPDRFDHIDWDKDEYNGKYKDYTDEQKKSILRHSSLLHRLLEKAPHYTIGHVDPTLSELQLIKEFSISEQAIYDELTSEIADEFKCLFLFDSMMRTINVYDLCNTCDDCGYRGDFSDTCPQCGSENFHGQYGEQTNIFVSTQNLSNEITIECDKDSIKNCLYITGGDDLINAAIASANPNGSRYIYNYENSYDDMPEELVENLKQYNEESKEYIQSHAYNITNDTVTGYNNVVNYVNKYFADDSKINYNLLPSDGNLIGYNSTTTALYEATDLYMFINDSMMPTIDISGIGIDDSVNNIINGFAKGFTYLDDNGNKQTGFENQIAVLNRTSAISLTVQRTIQNVAKLFYGSAYYDLKLTEDSYIQAKEDTSGKLIDGTGIWTGKVTLTSLTETDPDTGVNITRTKNLSVKISNDVSLYFQQCILIAMAEKDSFEKYNITSLTMSDDNFRERIHLYSLKELENLYQSFQMCLTVVTSADIQDENLRKKYYDFYYNRSQLISYELVTRNLQLNAIKSLYYYDSDTGLYSGELYLLRLAVNKYLNLERYIGDDDLWKTFCSYRREDTYQNDNYISDGLTNTEIIERVNELVQQANKELYKTSTPQYTLTSNLNNLLVIPAFKNIIDYFAVGNWIHVEIDDVVYPLRLLTYTIHYDDVSTIDVDFSTVEKYSDGISDIESIISSASSMSSSFNYITNQVNKTQEVNKVVKSNLLDGINAETTKLVNSDDQDILIDNTGILCRSYDPMTDTYDDVQLRILKNGLYFTDDNWKTLKTGIGKYYYVNEDGETIATAGVFGETIVGNLILGNNLKIISDNNKMTFDGDGLNVTNGINTVIIDPNSEKILVILNEAGEDIFNTQTNGNLSVQGDIRAENLYVKNKINLGGNGLDWTDIEDGNTIIARTREWLDHALLGNIFFGHVSDGESDGSYETTCGMIFTKTIITEEETILGAKDPVITSSTSFINEATLKADTFSICADLEVDNSATFKKDITVQDVKFSDLVEKIQDAEDKINDLHNDLEGLGLKEKEDYQDVLNKLNTTNENLKLLSNDVSDLKSKVGNLEDSFAALNLRVLELEAKING